VFVGVSVRRRTRPSVVIRPCGHKDGHSERQRRRACSRRTPSDHTSSILVELGTTRALQPRGSRPRPAVAPESTRAARDGEASERGHAQANRHARLKCLWSGAREQPSRESAQRCADLLAAGEEDSNLQSPDPESGAPARRSASLELQSSRGNARTVHPKSQRGQAPEKIRGGGTTQLSLLIQPC